MTIYSASRIKLYQSCRAQYYDRYVARLPETTSDTSSLFGSALHNAIEYYYQKGYDPITRFQRYITVMYARRMSRTNLTHSISYSDMFTLGRSILKAFPWSAFKPTHLEYDFTVNFYHPHFKTYLADLHGYVDMIIMYEDGRYVVYDFKSSKRKPTQKDLNKDLQFAIYRYALQQIFGSYPTHMYWYHLRDQSILEYLPVKYDEQILEIYDTILAMEIDGLIDVQHDRAICERCPPWCQRKRQ